MLELKLSKRFEAFSLDVNITCGGRVTGLFGPSASGKTTILNCIAGIVAADGGRIRLDDALWFDSDSAMNLSARHRRIGYVFQDSLLFDHLSVRRNLLYGHRAGAEGPAFDSVAALLGLEPLLKRHTTELSGGQRRLVAIGRAILRAPALLLFDEPLTGLDAELAGRVIIHLKRVLEEFAIPAIYVSHSISDVIYLCDDAIVIRAGAVVTQGRPTDVIASPGVLNDRNLVTLTNLSSARVIDVDPDEHVARCRIGEHVVTLYRDDLSPRMDVTLAVRATDIVLARKHPQQISARNILPGIVTRIEPVASKMIVWVDVGPLWMVEIGRGSAAELRLQPGASVHVIVKASAIQLYA